MSFSASTVRQKKGDKVNKRELLTKLEEVTKPNAPRFRNRAYWLGMKQGLEVSLIIGEDFDLVCTEVDLLRDLATPER